MTDIIENIMTIYGGMDNDEKKALVEAIGLAAINDGLYPDADKNPTATMPKTIKGTLGNPVPAGGSTKKKFVPRSNKPYWVKKITNINEAQKGFHAWESDWVNDTNDLAKDDVVLVGWKFEPKSYTLCKANFSNSAYIKLPDGTQLDNLSAVMETEKMGDLKEKAKELLGIT